LIAQVKAHFDCENVKIFKSQGEAGCLGPIGSDKHSSLQQPTFYLFKHAI